MPRQPLILVTNDDGIESKGLWAAVEGLLPLGEVLVVAPDRQWSGGARSMPPGVTGKLQTITRQVQGHTLTAYAVDASPALAISLEMDPAYHFTGDAAADYAAARFFTWRFARQILAHGLPGDVDALNVNIPAQATPHTPWRLARLSRCRYFHPLPPNRVNGQGRPGYKVIEDAWQTEADADIWAVCVQRKVAVTPLSLDLTSRLHLETLETWLRAQSEREAEPYLALTLPLSIPLVKTSPISN